MAEMIRQGQKPVQMAMKPEFLNKDQCILVFVKSPEKGMVKTRLARDIGDDLAVRLYRRFVCDIFETVTLSPFESRFCFFPERAHHRMVRWLGPLPVMVPQEGPDLGARLTNAFLKAFKEGFRRVIVIGTDSPDLSQCHLKKAFDGLRTHDAVIGPALDGGYYLIGFRRDTFTPAVFEKMPWSQATLYDRTCDILSELGLSLHTLQPWLDIDTLADLEHFIKNNANTPGAAPHTTGYLIRTGYRLTRDTV